MNEALRLILASFGICMLPSGQATAQTIGVETRPATPSTVSAYEAVGSPVHQPLPSVKEDRDKDDGGFYAKMGPGEVFFDTKAVLKTQGAVIPNATIKIHPDVTLITEVGYRRGDIGFSLTGGFPPRATIYGAGSLSTDGALGRIRYGTLVATVQYHLPVPGRFQPYVGGGPVLLLILNNKNLAVTQLDVRDHFGGAVQTGADFKLSRSMSLFLDAKKLFLKTEATAVLGSAPITGNIRLNPFVLTGGLSFRL